MIRASISFFVLAIIAYILGAYGIMGISLDVGKTLLVIFLALSVVSVSAYMATGRKPKILR
jgi:uncharacterized membrane protein YtjA (UPF0391 family)